jgi:hypothetical protein
VLTLDGRLKRPGAITLIATVDLVGGGFWFLLGTVATVLTLADPNSLKREPTAIVIFLLIVSLGLLLLACGIGMWQLKPHGRQLQLFFACIGLLGFPVGTVISIAILVYLSRPGVRLVFEGKPVDAYSEEELALVAAATAPSTTVIVLTAAAGVLLAIFVLGIFAAIAVPGLLRARIAGNEAATIGRLRALAAAETLYARSSGGYYDTPRCLARPSACLPGYTGSAFLAEQPEQQNGYRLTFYPGRRGAASSPSVSSSGVLSYVVMALPIAAEAGTRLFCVDQTGRIRVAPAGDQLPNPGAACAPEWPPLSGS